jgi:N-acetylglucosaminyl-diphospho-decaprenol L-rhamnosyltransferase
MRRVHHTSAFRYLSARYPRRWQAPLRWGLRIGLGARLLLAYVSDKVAAGASFQRRAGRAQAERPRTEGHGCDTR